MEWVPPKSCLTYLRSQRYQHAKLVRTTMTRPQNLEAGLTIRRGELPWEWNHLRCTSSLCIWACHFWLLAVCDMDVYWATQPSISMHTAWPHWLHYSHIYLLPRPYDIPPASYPASSLTFLDILPIQPQCFYEIKLIPPSLSSNTINRNEPWPTNIPLFLRITWISVSFPMYSSIIIIRFHTILVSTVTRPRRLHTDQNAIVGGRNSGAPVWDDKSYDMIGGLIPIMVMHIYSLSWLKKRAHALLIFLAPAALASAIM